jgi:hypothetical protein
MNEQADQVFGKVAAAGHSRTGPAFAEYRVSAIHRWLYNA